MKQENLSLIIFAGVFVAFFLIACAPDPRAIDPAFAAVALPGGTVENAVLFVSGLPGPETETALDLATLLRFPRTTFRAPDPWDGKIHEFSGVLLYPLLRRLGMKADASSIEVSAKNDYRVTVRVSDLAAVGHLLAYNMDGAFMSDKPELLKRGQLAIAINFPANKNIDIEVYKNQLVWQVNRIGIR